MWTVFFMREKGNRLKLWEIALLLGLAAGMLLAGWAERTQSRLAGEVLRLHVVANSDSDGDQAQKLRVRDAVLAEAEGLLEGCSTRAEAAERLAASRGRLKDAALAVLRGEDCDYPVQVSLEEVWFPTRDYEGFSLPCGDYLALRVVIGSGGGRNWWCVVFPPLCLGAAEDVTQAALASGVSPEDVELMTGEQGEYVLKFKLVELWEGLKERLSR